MTLNPETTEELANSSIRQTPTAASSTAAHLPSPLFDSKSGVVSGYLDLIKNPTTVCRDWFFRCICSLPGHPVLWAALLGLCLPLVTDLLAHTGEKISYVRTITELRAAYFFVAVLLVQTLFMPVFYLSAIRCFDELRHLMNTSTAGILNVRKSLITPDTRFQLKLLGSAFLFAAISEEVSASRYTRFVSGNWNVLDLWLVFANSIALMSFIWFVVMPISRTLLLARQIEKSIVPPLFEDNLGAPIASFGLRAGLVWAIPYFVVNGIGVIALDDAWSYLLPGFIGSTMAISFALIPGMRLRRCIRLVKNAELARVNAAVKVCRSHVGPGEIDSEQTVEIVRLLQYRREVQGVREWPFEARLIRGFSLYFLLIPMTWVASAVVEMVVERLAA